MHHWRTLTLTITTKQQNMSSHSYISWSKSSFQANYTEATFIIFIKHSIDATPGAKTEHFKAKGI